MSYPTHLTCPYCPAQSYPVPLPELIQKDRLMLFRCPAYHEFYVEEEKTRETSIDQ